MTSDVRSHVRSFAWATALVVLTPVFSAQADPFVTPGAVCRTLVAEEAPNLRAEDSGSVTVLSIVEAGPLGTLTIICPLVRDVRDGVRASLAVDIAVGPEPDQPARCELRATDVVVNRLRTRSVSTPDVTEPGDGRFVRVETPTILVSSDDALSALCFLQRGDRLASLTLSLR